MNPQYVIFVSGLTSEISHESQINAFKKGYKEDNFVSFRYTEINNINNFIKNNVVEAVILFSKACSLAQQVNIDKSKIYCVEPYNCNVDKIRYKGIPAKNMFIHYKACARGKDAKEGANDTSSSKSHITALTDSVIKIFKGNSSTPPPSSSSNQTTFSGKITDDKGQPVVGATVKIDPPKEYPDTPFQNSTESDEFRKWLLEKYPEYKTKPKPYNVDPPPQPKSINTQALKKAWDEKGAEYDSTAANSTFASRGYIDGCPKSCDPQEVFSTIPPSFDSLYEVLFQKIKTCGTACSSEDLYEVFKKSGTTKMKGYAAYTVFEWFINRISYIRNYSEKYNKYIKDKEDLIAKGEPYNPLTDPNLEEHHLYYTKDPILYADLSIPENKTFVLNVLENYDEPAIWMNEILNIYQAPWYFDYGPDKPTQIIKRPGASDTSTETVTDKDGNWEITTPTTFDPQTSTVTISKEGHEIREVTNIQQTGGDITGGTGKQFDSINITIPPTPDPTATATNKVNQEVLTEETNLIKQQGNSELSAQEKLANSANCHNCWGLSSL